MPLDLLLNSPIATAILGLTCLGLLFFGKVSVLPKLEELEETKKELTRIQAENVTLLERYNVSINDVNSALEKLLSNSTNDTGRYSTDFLAKLTAIVEKVNKMDLIISKHPNNLELSILDLNRNITDIYRELNDLVKGYETVASTLLQQSGKDDKFTGMEKLR